MTWYENLKFLRESKGLSQQEVADHVNINRSTIGYYELGKRQPLARILVKLADFYGVTINEIYEGLADHDHNIESMIESATKIFKDEKISKETKAEAIKRIMDLWTSEQREGAIAL